MGEYQFEMTATITDIITVYADSLDEAESLAQDEADAWYAVAPAGYSVNWDDCQVNLVSEPEDEEDE